MKKHFPDWLFYTLVLIIGVIIMFYTMKYGSPKKLDDLKTAHERLDTIIKQQINIESLLNDSDNEIMIEEISIGYIENHSNLKKEIILLERNEIILEDNKKLNLKSYYNESWDGKCLYIFAKYRKTLHNELNFILKNGNNIKNNELKIIN